MSRRRLPPRLDIAVKSLDDEGMGLGTHGSRTVRVKGALPGESASARVVGRRRGAVLTVADEGVAEPATQRVPARCDAYPRCGGCALQHLADDEQLALKDRRLRAELAAAGAAPQRWRAPFTGPRLHYRRKARLGVRQLGDAVLVGFRETFGGRIVRMNDCPALVPELAALPAALAALVAELSVANQIPQVELAAGDDASALILRHLAPLTTADEQRLIGFEAAHGIDVYTQAAGYDSIRRLHGGPRLLSYRLADFGVCLRFEPADFVQVNAWVNEALVRAACQALAGLERIADLFCGIGNFSLPLARQGSRVVGIEATATSVARARDNAVFNGLRSNTEFVVADLYAAQAPTLPLNGVQALLLDPPRSGAGAHLEAWLVPSVQRILYVSCNPTTFASDTGRLVQHGFRLLECQAFDMFPHTGHVEVLGVFERYGSR